MKTSIKLSTLTALVVGMLILGTGLPAYASETVTPIPSEGQTSLPDYVGAPAKAHPTANSGVPQNPLLWPNPFNSVHDDPWNSDVVDIPGPLGRDPVIFSSTLVDARRYKDPLSDMFECVGTTFTSQGHMIASCFGKDEASVVLLDPETLEVYDTYLVPVTIPEDVDSAQLSTIMNGLSASYIIYDKQERFYISIKGNKIIALVEGDSGTSPKLELVQEYDMNQWVQEGNRISGLAMDWQGRIWFYLSGAQETSNSPSVPGAVYVLDPALYPEDAAIKSYTFDKYGQDEQIRNSMAITTSGVYIVTSKNMYRIGFDFEGELRAVWKEEYKNAGYTKPGQYNAGSGTTPTILGEGKYVAITDNDDPWMHVVVYRTDAPPLAPNEKRIVCEVPVFQFAEGGALDNSLLGSRLSMIVENNYGYEFNFDTLAVKDSEPGFERIDIDPNGTGCTKVWVNTQIASTSSAKLSTRTGLIYTYARQYDDQNDVWVYYWTALDFRTGEVVWQKMAGTGHTRFDAFWPALIVGPNETLYVGMLGGLAAMKDTP
ncbi:MAG: hypothetical protein H6Q38_1035 [Chloroflexi bacterium]|nr:hypothetical protein [Chloroflexota bacterium]